MAYSQTSESFFFLKQFFFTVYNHWGWRREIYLSNTHSFPRQDIFLKKYDQFYLKYIAIFSIYMFFSHIFFLSWPKTTSEMARRRISQHSGCPTYPPFNWRICGFSSAESLCLLGIHLWHSHASPYRRKAWCARRTSGGPLAKGFGGTKFKRISILNNISIFTVL